jgi:hypothetical protein
MGQRTNPLARQGRASGFVHWRKAEIISSEPVQGLKIDKSLRDQAPATNIFLLNKKPDSSSGPEPKASEGQKPEPATRYKTR